MKYIHFYGNAGFCGTHYDEFLELDDDVPDSEIDDVSINFALDNADSYRWGENFASEEEEQQYFEDAVGNSGWVEVSEEEFENLKELYS